MIKPTYIFCSFLLILFISCQKKLPESFQLNLNQLQDSTKIEFSVTGLAGPEAVRYDNDMDVFFISNFNGGGNVRDENGFITMVSQRGTILDMKYMVGTQDHPLHAPRGMFIVDKELFVADIDGVHVFNKITGEWLQFIDFSSFNPGFLNDISSDGSSTLFVTDTGTARVYKIENYIPSVYLDSLSIYPNGITYNSSTNEFLLLPWRGDKSFYSFNASIDTLKLFSSLSGGFFDGAEYIGNTLLVTSQLDSAIYAFDGKQESLIIKTVGSPADIGLDTRRHVLGVPYINLNRVDFWKLPMN